ncbi:hypothetical protein AbraIFM66951_001614 [Aspergillus brasiliensis]|uniref:Uncharacterized protein n=1 Tax=Aspergillus brasiliensis TaxID=319629 RepID=A0A9W5YQ48_9EURO|nr:hypothetical protein AbraCBS73388_005198 [Aspergillus brasiliensis]GKZ49210.1 hypothetical protein AbraIFM66951_001614 [Aspergillus brasiliensis]
MLFLKPTILLALALTAVASPIAYPTTDAGVGLVGRAQKKDVDCDGKRFTVADINNAIKQARLVQNEKDNGVGGYGKYPETYNNNEGFFNSPSQLYEYPLVSGTFSGKKGPRPGLYRVIMNEKYNYMGSVYHLKDGSNVFMQCINVEDRSTTTATTTTTTTTTKATAKATTKASSSKSGSKSGGKSGKKSGKKTGTKNGTH